MGQASYWCSLIWIPRCLSIWNMNWEWVDWNNNCFHHGWSYCLIMQMDHTSHNQAFALHTSYVPIYYCLHSLVSIPYTRAYLNYISCCVSYVVYKKYLYSYFYENLSSWNKPSSIFMTFLGQTPYDPKYSCERMNRQFPMLILSSKCLWQMSILLCI